MTPSFPICGLGTTGVQWYIGALGNVMIKQVSMPFGNAAYFTAVVPASNNGTNLILDKTIVYSVLADISYNGTPDDVTTFNYPGRSAFIEWSVTNLRWELTIVVKEVANGYFYSPSGGYCYQSLATDISFVPYVLYYLALK